MPGKTEFNNLWLSNDKYKTWLKREADPSCTKTFDVSNMGEELWSAMLKGKTLRQPKGGTKVCQPVLNYLKSNANRIHYYGKFVEKFGKFIGKNMCETLLACSCSRLKSCSGCSARVELQPSYKEGVFLQALCDCTVGHSRCFRRF